MKRIAFIIVLMLAVLSAGAVDTLSFDVMARKKDGSQSRETLYVVGNSALMIPTMGIIKDFAHTYRIDMGGGIYVVVMEEHKHPHVDMLDILGRSDIDDHEMFMFKGNTVVYILGSGQGQLTLTVVPEHTDGFRSMISGWKNYGCDGCETAPEPIASACDTGVIADAFRNTDGRPKSEPKPAVATPFELDIGAMPTLRFGRYPLSATASDVVGKLAGEGLSPRIGKNKSYTDPEIVLQFNQPGCRVANPEREFWMSPRSVTIPGYDGGNPLQCYVYIAENEQPSRVYNGFCITFGFDFGSAYFDDPKQEKAFRNTQKKRAEHLFAFIADTLRSKGVPLEGNKKKQKCDGYILDIEQYANRYGVSLRIRRYGDWPIPESIWHLK